MYSYQFLFTVLSVNSISRINFAVAIGGKVKKMKKDLEELFSEMHFTQQDLPGSVFWPCSQGLCPRQMGKPKDEPLSGREELSNQP